MPRADRRTEGTVIRMRGHGFYTVVLANGHEVLARMSGRMSKNHIRVIQDDRVRLEISPADSYRAASFTATSDSRYDF